MCTVLSTAHDETVKYCVQAKPWFKARVCNNQTRPFASMQTVGATKQSGLQLLYILFGELACDATVRVCLQMIQKQQTKIMRPLNSIRHLLLASTLLKKLVPCWSLPGGLVIKGCGTLMKGGS